MAFDEVDEMFKRLMLHPGMKGLLVFNHHGICIKTNMDKEKTRNVMGLISPFMDQVNRAGNSLLYEDSWEMIRIRSFKGPYVTRIFATIGEIFGGIWGNS